MMKDIFCGFKKKLRQLTGRNGRYFAQLIRRNDVENIVKTGPIPNSCLCERDSDRPFRRNIRPNRRTSRPVLVSLASCFKLSAAADSSLSRQRMNFEESNASIFACCSKSIRSEFLLVGKQPLMHRPEFPCSTVPRIDHHRARGHASPTKKADFPGIEMNKRGLIVKWGLFS